MKSNEISSSRPTQVNTAAAEAPLQPRDAGRRQRVVLAPREHPRAAGGTTTTPAATAADRDHARARGVTARARGVTRSCRNRRRRWRRRAGARESSPHPRRSEQAAARASVSSRWCIRAAPPRAGRHRRAVVPLTGTARDDVAHTGHSVRYIALPPPPRTCDRQTHGDESYRGGYCAPRTWTCRTVPGTLRGPPRPPPPGDAEGVAPRPVMRFSAARSSPSPAPPPTSCTCAPSHWHGAPTHCAPINQHSALRGHSYLQGHGRRNHSMATTYPKMHFLNTDRPELHFT